MTAANSKITILLLLNNTPTVTTNQRETKTMGLVHATYNNDNHKSQVVVHNYENINLAVFHIRL